MFSRCFLRYNKVHELIRRFSSTEPYTSATFQDGIAKIVMCHAKTRNSLSLAMMEDIITKITQHESDPNLRVIILTAEGPIFSAGHNLKELSPEQGRDQHNKVFNLASQLMYKIIDCPVPIIARVDGLAAAAGCQLVAQCDLAFCTERSTFSTPGANFGIFCSTPGVALARCVPKMTALKMLLTGATISSSEAEAKGLVTKACSNNNLDEEIGTVCDAIKAKSRSVVEVGKRFYYKQVGNDVRTAYNMGAQQMVDNLQMDDGKEGVKSFIEKRRPVWKN